MPKARLENPIARAVLQFLDAASSSRPENDHEKSSLLHAAPKRWVVYEPMMLLPSGSFADPEWTAFLDGQDPTTTTTAAALWREIVASTAQSTGLRLTHLAVNEGIPPRVHGGGGGREENVLRSPSGLRMLHGDFGGADEHGTASDAAFWVSTKQNGIVQVWAPRWTMFSRGNVKEKARLLGFHRRPESRPNKTRGMEAQQKEDDEEQARFAPRYGVDLAGKWAVDLYAGIGYFALSYARLGLRVLCWELNPWSVEGLRRGAAANRVSVRVVRDAELLARPTAELLAGPEQMVVFLEDNSNAETRIRELRGASSSSGLEVVHVNCGFLPSSMDTWRPARSMLGPEEDGWLHLHENVAVADIETRRRHVQDMFDLWDHEAADDRKARVEHVELVKTFAPDVWHCVFDVYVTQSSRENA